MENQENDRNDDGRRGQHHQERLPGNHRQLGEKIGDRKEQSLPNQISQMASVVSQDTQKGSWRKANPEAEENGPQPQQEESQIKGEFAEDVVLQKWNERQAEDDAGIKEDHADQPQGEAFSPRQPISEKIRKKEVDKMKADIK